jgi:predicted enzyme related to lactoylglutathione lyase
MKLQFLYRPVSELKPAVDFYRETLGWEEAWREGDTTVAFKMPGTDVALMVDASPGLPPGPVFFLDDARAYRARHAGKLDFTLEPMAIRGGYIAGFVDPEGNLIYVLDQSTPGTATPEE